MAKAKRNLKTHPKVRDEDDTSTFTDPSRQDQIGSADAGRSEVVDVFGKEETIDTGSVDLDSSTEGDARSMAQEDGSGGDTGGSAVSSTQRGADADTRVARGSRGQSQRGDGDGDDTYSRSVRKRIARERALVNRERTLREQTQRELAEERTARTALTERLDRIERAQTEVTANADVKALQAQIDALIPQIATATEVGDTKKAFELQIKLGDLQGDLKIRKYELAQQARQATTQQRQTATTQATDTTSEVDPAAAESAERFKRANRHWWNRSANKSARDDAITIDREILDELRAGELDFEPYSDEHWEEVARRLHETYPDLEIQDLDGVAYEFGEDEGEPMNNGRDQRQNGRRAGNPGTRGAQQTGRRNTTEADLARQGKVTLNESDFNTMRLFKMDPNSPTDKKYFAKEKMRSILSGERQAERGNR